MQETTEVEQLCVKVLSDDISQVLAKTVGASGLAGILAIDKTGNIHVLRPENVGQHPAQFPIKTKEIESITPVSVVAYKGSFCISLVIGGKACIFCIG